MSASSFYFVFAGLFVANLYFCINKDDDVSYIIMERKPTGSEAIRRIRYVIVKIILSIYGGGVASIILKKKLLDQYDGFSVISRHKLAVIFFSIVLCWGGLGIMQNGIRRLQNRKTRSPYDVSVAMYNLHIRRGGKN